MHFPFCFVVRKYYVVVKINKNDKNVDFLAVNCSLAFLGYLFRNKTRISKKLKTCYSDQQMATTPKPNNASAVEDLYHIEKGNCIDEICPICRKGSDKKNDCACRVCGRVYHRQCCENDGKYTQFDLSAMDRAFTNVGWSCVDCDNMAINTLTPELHMQIYDLFEKFDENEDGSITLKQFLASREHVLGRELSKEEQDEEKACFQTLDRNDDGEIEFAEFLSYEAERYIKKFDKDTLIRLLTPLEKKNAKRLFDLFDANGDGVIDYWESIQNFGHMSWYQIINRVEDLSTNTVQLLEENMPTTSTTKAEVFDNTVAVATAHVQQLPAKSIHVRECDENCDGTVSWEEFLRGHAYDIITARPNKARRTITIKRQATESEDASNTHQQQVASMS